MHFLLFCKRQKMLSLQQCGVRSSLLRRRLVRRTFEISSPSCTTPTILRSCSGKVPSEHSFGYSQQYDNSSQKRQVPGLEVNRSKVASVPWRRQAEEVQKIARHVGGKIGSTTSLERRKFGTDTSSSLIHLPDAIERELSSGAQNTTKLVWGTSSKYHSDLTPETRSFRLLPTSHVPRTNLHTNATYHRTYKKSWDYRWNPSLSSLVQQQACSFSTQPQQDDPKVREANNSPDDKSFGAPPDKKAAPKVIPSLKMSRTRIPTPSSSPPEAPNPLTTLAKTTPKNIIRKGLDLIIRVFDVGLRFLWRLPFNIIYYLRHPLEAKQYMLDMKKTVMDEVDHYWVGTKVSSTVVGQRVSAW